MSEIMEKYNKEAVDEAAIPAIKKLAKVGTSLKDLAEAFDKSIDEIESIINTPED